jgi:hypothetical protein
MHAQTRAEPCHPTAASTPHRFAHLCCCCCCWWVLCYAAEMCRGKPEKVMNGVWPDDCRDNAPGAVCTAVCKMDAWSWYNKTGVPTSTCRPGMWQGCSMHSQQVLCGCRSLPCSPSLAQGSVHTWQVLPTYAGVAGQLVTDRLRIVCCSVADGKWSKPEHPSFCHKQRAQGKQRWAACGKQVVTICLCLIHACPRPTHTHTY